MQVLVIGAHPDDCDIKAGGTAALWNRHGHAVRFVSMTNGNAGHHLQQGEDLARRRKEEAKEAGKTLGVEYLVLDHDDGKLEVTLENRLEVIRLIRQTKPDLVLTHRPNDYHPDHRYTSQLVQDAAFMVTVPPIAPETPFLETNPVFGYLYDSFTKPNSFEPDVVVAIDDVLDLLIEALHSHTSQVYEWLPFNWGISDRVPQGQAERKTFIKKWYCERFGGLADRHRELLIQRYGREKGRTIRHVEAFEISEYGSPLSLELRHELFP